MQNASEAITNLMASLESYYDAARNAMLVKKAVKKYGKTQSIVALIGQEGLAAAQTFSMKGFWQKTKDFLIKIWEKIKEWWGRFWGMFFSNQKKMEELSKTTKSLVRPSEYEGTDLAILTRFLDEIKSKIEIVSAAAEGKPETTSDLQNFDNWSKESDGVGTTIEQRKVLIKINTIEDVKKRASSIAEILKKCAAFKEKIAKIADAGLKAAKQIKEDDKRDEAKAAIEANKLASKVMTKVVAQVYKAANAEAARLAAHSALK